MQPQTPDAAPEEQSVRQLKRIGHALVDKIADEISSNYPLLHRQQAIGIVYAYFNVVLLRNTDILFETVHSGWHFANMDKATIKKVNAFLLNVQLQQIMDWEQEQRHGIYTRGLAQRKAASSKPKASKQEQVTTHIIALNNYHLIHAHYGFILFAESDEILKDAGAQKLLENLQSFCRTEGGQRVTLVNDVDNIIEWRNFFQQKQELAKLESFYSAYFDYMDRLASQVPALEVTVAAAPAPSVSNSRKGKHPAHQLPKTKPSIDVKGLLLQRCYTEGVCSTEALQQLVAEYPALEEEIFKYVIEIARVQRRQETTAVVAVEEVAQAMIAPQPTEIAATIAETPLAEFPMPVNSSTAKKYTVPEDFRQQHPVVWVLSILDRCHGIAMTPIVAILYKFFLLRGDFSSAITFLKNVGAPKDTNELVARVLYNVLVIATNQQEEARLDLQILQETDHFARLAYGVLLQEGIGFAQDKSLAITKLSSLPFENEKFKLYLCLCYLSQPLSDNPNAAIEGFKLLRELQQRHCRDSVFYHLLATFYRNGTIVSQDYQQMLYYYELAAAGRNPNAIYELAACYLIGLGVKQNVKKAKDLVNPIRKTIDKAKGLGVIATVYAQLFSEGVILQQLTSHEVLGLREYLKLQLNIVMVGAVDIVALVRTYNISYRLASLLVSMKQNSMVEAYIGYLQKFFFDLYYQGARLLREKPADENYAKILQLAPDWVRLLSFNTDTQMLFGKSKELYLAQKYTTAWQNFMQLQKAAFDLGMAVMLDLSRKYTGYCKFMLHLKTQAQGEDSFITIVTEYLSEHTPNISDYENIAQHILESYKRLDSSVSKEDLREAIHTILKQQLPAIQSNATIIRLEDRPSVFDNSYCFFRLLQEHVREERRQVVQDALARGYI